MVKIYLHQAKAEGHRWRVREEESHHKKGWVSEAADRNWVDLEILQLSCTVISFALICLVARVTCSAVDSGVV